MDQYFVGKLIKCDETKSFEIFKWLSKLISYPFFKKRWVDGWRNTKYRNRCQLNTLTDIEIDRSWLFDNLTLPILFRCW